jgi:hypothetical protein
MTLYLSPLIVGKSRGAVQKIFGHGEPPMVFMEGDR